MMFQTKGNSIFVYKSVATRVEALSHSRKGLSCNVCRPICYTQKLTTQIAEIDFLRDIKWGETGLVPVIAQDVDTGEILMQAYTDEAGVRETLKTRLATFYSRSRQKPWCKGDTSGNYINVKEIYVDCDKDSIIYLGEPTGPACHTGQDTCYFTQINVDCKTKVFKPSNKEVAVKCAAPTLQVLEDMIECRKLSEDNRATGRKSWTLKLLNDPKLLCSKVREEANEFCQTYEMNEGKDRATAEMADLLYHAMVLMNLQDISVKNVCKILRSRFNISGIEEKAKRNVIIN